MSWWVYLEDREAEPRCGYPGDCPKPCYPAVEVDSHAEGGTYAVGGVPDAELNVTYNYGRLFAQAFDGQGFVETIHERPASEVVEVLERAVERLGTAQSDDYWAATEGNAGHALAVLLGWAKQHPKAVFRVS